MSSNNQTDAFASYSHVAYIPYVGVEDISDGLREVSSVEFCNSVLYSVSKKEDFEGVCAAFACVVESAETNLKTVRERVSRDSRPDTLIKNALCITCLYTGYTRGAVKCKFFYKDEGKSFLLRAVLLCAYLAHINRDVGDIENTTDDLSNAICQIIIVEALSSTSLSDRRCNNAPHFCLFF
ncbi:hypothetical protein [Anaplasma phagocytophilum]|uniref:hypothetical protein n=1 Tax=Anaplasma phagocytophilum TaxID=948 RepID=UPI00201AEF2B